MNPKLMALIALAIVGVGAGFPKPKHLKLGKGQCKWVPTPDEKATKGAKSLRCTLAKGMRLIVDSAGVGSGGSQAMAVSDSAGVGSGGNLSCTWVKADRKADPKPDLMYLSCAVAVQLTVDSAGVGSGGNQ